MQNAGRVNETVERPSVRPSVRLSFHLSVPSNDSSSAFSAEHPVGRRYQPIASGAGVAYQLQACSAASSGSLQQRLAVSC